jgi:hypothetical protein
LPPQNAGPPGGASRARLQRDLGLLSIYRGLQDDPESRRETITFSRLEKISLHFAQEYGSLAAGAVRAGDTLI